METVLINLKNGRVLTINNVRTTLISGNYLILISKQSEVDTISPEQTPYLLTTNEVYDLGEIINYTVKTETKQYA